MKSPGETFMAAATIALTEASLLEATSSATASALAYPYDAVCDPYVPLSNAVEK